MAYFLFFPLNKFCESSVCYLNTCLCCCLVASKLLIYEYDLLLLLLQYTSMIADPPISNRTQFPKQEAQAFILQWKTRFYGKFFACFYTLSQPIDNFFEKITHTHTHRLRQRYCKRPPAFDGIFLVFFYAVAPETFSFIINCHGYVGYARLGQGQELQELIA